MLLKEKKINKTFFIREKNKISTKKFLENFIKPFEKSNSKKENISENISEYLVNIR